MSAPSYPDTTTAEEHTDVAATTNDRTYSQALRRMSLWPYLGCMTFLPIWLFGMERVAPDQRPVPTSAAEWALFTVAVAACGAVSWLGLAWQKRRNPERYAACKAVTAARRAGFWTGSLTARRAADPEVTAQSPSGFWGFDRRNAGRGFMVVAVAVLVLGPAVFLWLPRTLFLMLLALLAMVVFRRIAVAGDRPEAARRSAAMATGGGGGRPRVAQPPAVAAERRPDSEVPDRRRGRRPV